MRRILIDSGILLSYYQQQEPLHQAVVSFFDQTPAQLITSPICIAEVLWLLGDPGDRRVLAAQNHLLAAVSRGGLQVVDLLPEDYSRIAELNTRYADLPGDRRPHAGDHLGAAGDRRDPHARQRFRCLPPLSA
jgi:predicted nucleic acid-binding protein